MGPGVRFIPASHLSVSGTIVYVAVMVVGMSINIATPFILHRGQSLKVDAQSDPGLVAADTRSEA